MSSLIAIDPGKRTGWALFEAGELVEACAIDESALLVATSFARLVDRGSVCVIELPVVYPHGGKGDPNQLIALAVLVGDLRGFYRRAGFDVVLVKPRTWKGTVPKAVHNRRTLAALTPEELAILPKRPRARDFDHNMIDAVGLGLWQLKRKGER